MLKILRLLCFFKLILHWDTRRKNTTEINSCNRPIFPNTQQLNLRCVVINQETLLKPQDMPTEVFHHVEPPSFYFNALFACRSCTQCVTNQPISLQNHPFCHIEKNKPWELQDWGGRVSLSEKKGQDSCLTCLLLYQG